MTIQDDIEETLPKSDLVLIPLLVVVTLVALLALGEFAARLFFAENRAESCGTETAAGVPLMQPNCVSYVKSPEGPETVNRYNDCGYRSPDPCRTRRPGALRVAVMGASTAQGNKVPYDDTFAARLSQSLSRGCGRPVEFQNMGYPGAKLLDIYRRTDEALAMRPDLILLVLTPYELKAMISPAELEKRDVSLALIGTAHAAEGPAQTPAVRSLVARLSDLAYNSRLLVVAQHFMFQDRATYVNLYLLHGDDADYLRLPYSANWEQRLRDFETLLREMAARAKAAGVPLMLALGPQRIQTSLLDSRVQPPGVDPFEIGRRLGAIAARHGVLFQDTLDGFGAVKDPDALFYAVDGHIDAAGNAVVAKSVLDRLVQDAPVFQGCRGATIAGR
jgi:hypothetical protein